MFALGSIDHGDPVDGILLQVADEIATMGDLTMENGPGLTLLGWARRIRAAVRLLQRSETRKPIGEDDEPTMRPTGDKEGGDR